MSTKRLASALFVAGMIALCLPTGAQAATAGVQIEGVTITGQDMSQLFDALRRALSPTDHSIHLVVSIRKPSEMPPYDQQYHYAGITDDSNGNRSLHVWINPNLAAQDEQNALAAGCMLALTDGGYAGTAFKTLYDIYAKEDAQLPVSAPDPFLNRHKFAAAMVAEFNAAR